MYRTSFYSTFLEDYSFSCGFEFFFSENYQDCLSDIKAATSLKPNYLKAIIRGEIESQLKI